jgi:aspartate ammonia-lyase
MLFEFYPRASVLAGLIFLPDTRKETDSLGMVDVPLRAYYGAFTARALSNFRISGLVIDKELIHSLVQVKLACAESNHELGLLNKRRKGAIVKAAQEVLEGRFDDAFPLDIFQAGAGTAWNMNVNEVIANRANEILHSRVGCYEKVHPNDHVNMSQSSNDVIPTATRITVLKLIGTLFEELSSLEESFTAKARKFKNVVKVSRTHTRDAVPVTFGQEFNAYASMLKTGRKRLQRCLENIRHVPLGGTAVGTGVNTCNGYSRIVLKHLRETTKLDLVQASDLVEKTQFVSDFLEFIDALGEICTDLIKLSSDLMLLGSGPNTGLNELVLPPVEPGSSMMPGKINPSIIECCNMVCFQILGNRTAVEKAAASGNFDLNVYVPLIAFNLFNSVKWLSNAVRMLNEKCVKGLSVNISRAKYFFDHSGTLATLISPIVGYEKAAALAKESLHKNVTIAQLVLKKRILSEEQLARLIAYSNRPNLSIIEKLKTNKL